jgi:hypothetical protein
MLAAFTLPAFLFLSLLFLVFLCFSLVYAHQRQAKKNIVSSCVFCGACYQKTPPQTGCPVLAGKCAAEANECGGKDGMLTIACQIASMTCVQSRNKMMQCTSYITLSSVHLVM